MLPLSLRGAVAAMLVSASSLLVTAARPPADPTPARETAATLYHTDPEHLWNRVHAALLVRTGPDGKDYGHDRLEPLLWGESVHLRKGKPAGRAVAVLEEFIKHEGETLVRDPMMRAVLQRDLWLVANWVAGDANDDSKKLLGLLGKVIRRLALTSQQIAELPDNYGAAVASKVYAGGFDAATPERPYLPADLLKADGPWVCVGRPDGPTAPAHLDEGGGNRFTNSAFLVFLKLPAGRAATLDYLKRLAAFRGPLYLPNADEKSNRLLVNLPNPALPQWPKGAEVALVRRALLIDAARRVVATRLVESVQLRAMRADTPALTAEVVGEFHGGKQDGQTFAEFQLRRADLFAGAAGGVRDVSEARDFKTGFRAHLWDEFAERGSPASTAAPFPERSQPFKNNRASCFGCHQFPGVYGFNSFHEDFPFAVSRDLRKPGVGGYVPKSHSLVPLSVEQVERAAVKWKEEQPGWAALRKLIAD
jgi:hypothetical protein